MASKIHDRLSHNRVAEIEHDGFQVVRLIRRDADVVITDAASFSATMLANVQDRQLRNCRRFAGNTYIRTAENTAGA